MTKKIIHENTIYIKHVEQTLKIIGAYIDCKSPLTRGNFVHYPFLKLLFIGIKMTRISSLAVAVIANNS